ncbi:hypothetical protein [Paraglaciecola sp. L1A13]|uniref:DUF6942 family protein n=1 Tax=Paraglaciecola sp. L1A13 TaxID=2686359 RepID=UPI00131E833E|nr:hypothetical protein [Paraglaciecola sp. L1A13]
MTNAIIFNAGLGDRNARINVYIANRPNYQDFATISGLKELSDGDIEALNRHCGNGWRKVFNVYAKLLFAWRSADPKLAKELPGAKCLNWQTYRDNFLLQAGSQTSLLFSPPIFRNQFDSPDECRLGANNTYNIIMGRTYAKSLLLSTAPKNATAASINLVWLDEEFAYDTVQRVVVCPYFDYRQLSNAKIIRLVEILISL